MKTNGTEAFADIEIPADIGKCQLATLRCKVDTGTGGNVMPLCTFTKLFPKWFDTDGHPTGLAPSTTCLTAYNGSPIRQFETFRTHIDWTPQGKQTTNCLHTQWYVAETPGPAILGLPTCNKLGIVELNCAVNLQQKRTMQKKTLQLNVNGCIMTLRHCRHSAQERTSSVHTQIALKVSDASQVPTTSPFQRMPDQLSTLHESALLQCGPWCTRSWMNGRSQTSLPQLKNQQTGYHLWPTP